MASNPDRMWRDGPVLKVLDEMIHAHKMAVEDHKAMNLPGEARVLESTVRNLQELKSRIIEESYERGFVRWIKRMLWKRS